MSVHDEMAETFALAKPRPVVVRLVHIETDTVVNEFDVTGMTGMEIQHWAEYLEAVSGDAYTTEIPGWEAA